MKKPRINTKALRCKFIFAKNVKVWEYPRMNATIDAKYRAQIKHFAVGDLVRIEPQSEDVVVLRRLHPAPDKRYKPRIVRRKNGDLVSVGGKPVTSEEVKRILEDDL